MKTSPFTTTSFSTNTNTNAINKVPRPMNCFMTYRLEKQREIVEKCPGANHRDISKIIAKWWKEMTPAEKEPYRLQAEKSKADHIKLYPGYKFCPKKKTSKPRAYKKRPENEFTARDFENKKQLFELYHEGKEPSEITAKNLLIDYTPKKKSSAASSNNNNLKRSSSSPLSSLSYPSSQRSSNKQTDSPYNTEMLYPPHGSSYYSGSASVPSHSVYSPSPSPYDDPNGSDTTSAGDYSGAINYNLYPTHYAAYSVEGHTTTSAYAYAYHPYATGATATAAYYHHYGGHETSATAAAVASHHQQADYHLKTNYAVSSQQQQQTFHHSIVPRGGSEPASFAPYNGYSASPALLTRPFYYQ